MTVNLRTCQYYEDFIVRLALSAVVTDRQAVAMSWPCSQRKVATTIASVGSIEIVPYARASYSLFSPRRPYKFGVHERGKRI